MLIIVAMPFSSASSFEQPSKSSSGADSCNPAKNDCQQGYHCSGDRNDFQVNKCCQDGTEYDFYKDKCIPSCIDKDKDSYGDNCINGPDCDDNNASLNSGIVEYCDGEDNNCDGLIDNDCIVKKDPFSKPFFSFNFTKQEEICDGIDNNGDKLIDEGCKNYTKCMYYSKDVISDFNNSSYLCNQKNSAECSKDENCFYDGERNFPFLLVLNNLCVSKNSIKEYFNYKQSSCFDCKNNKDCCLQKTGCKFVTNMCITNTEYDNNPVNDGVFCRYCGVEGTSCTKEDCLAFGDCNFIDGFFLDYCVPKQHFYELDVNSFQKSNSGKTDYTNVDQCKMCGIAVANKCNEKECKALGDNCVYSTSFLIFSSCNSNTTTTSTVISDGSNCALCGHGPSSNCEENECSSLGSCVFNPGIIGDTCTPKQSDSIKKCDVVDRCFDLLKDGNETDVDCGGDCLPCNPFDTFIEFKSVTEGNYIYGSNYKYTWNRKDVALHVSLKDNDGIKEISPEILIDGKFVPIGYQLEDLNQTEQLIKLNFCTDAYCPSPMQEFVLFKITVKDNKDQITVDKLQFEILLKDETLSVSPQIVSQGPVNIFYNSLKSCSKDSISVKFKDPLGKEQTLELKNIRLTYSDNDKRCIFQGSYTPKDAGKYDSFSIGWSSFKDVAFYKINYDTRLDDAFSVPRVYKLPYDKFSLVFTAQKEIKFSGGAFLMLDGMIDNLPAIFKIRRTNGTELLPRDAEQLQECYTSKKVALAKPIENYQEVQATFCDNILLKEGEEFVIEYYNPGHYEFSVAKVMPYYYSNGKAVLIRDDLEADVISPDYMVITNRDKLIEWYSYKESVPSDYLKLTFTKLYENALIQKTVVEDISSLNPRYPWKNLKEWSTFNYMTRQLSQEEVSSDIQNYKQSIQDLNFVTKILGIFQVFIELANKVGLFLPSNFEQIVINPDLKSSFEVTEFIDEIRKETIDRCPSCKNVILLGNDYVLPYGLVGLESQKSPFLKQTDATYVPYRKILTSDSVNHAEADVIQDITIVLPDNSSSFPKTIDAAKNEITVRFSKRTLLNSQKIGYENTIIEPKVVSIKDKITCGDLITSKGVVIFVGDTDSNSYIKECGLNTAKNVDLEVHNQDLKDTNYSMFFRDYMIYKDKNLISNKPKETILIYGSSDQGLANGLKITSDLYKNGLEDWKGSTAFYIDNIIVPIVESFTSGFLFLLAFEAICGAAAGTIGLLPPALGCLAAITPYLLAAGTVGFAACVGSDECSNIAHESYMYYFHPSAGGSMLFTVPDETDEIKLNTWANVGGIALSFGVTLDITVAKNTGLFISRAINAERVEWLAARISYKLTPEKLKLIKFKFRDVPDVKRVQSIIKGEDWPVQSKVFAKNSEIEDKFLQQLHTKIGSKGITADDIEAVSKLYVNFDRDIEKLNSLLSKNLKIEDLHALAKLSAGSNQLTKIDELLKMGISPKHILQMGFDDLDNAYTFLKSNWDEISKAADSFSELNDMQKSALKRIIAKTYNENGEEVEEILKKLKDAEFDAGYIKFNELLESVSKADVSLRYAEFKYSLELYSIYYWELKDIDTLLKLKSAFPRTNLLKANINPKSAVLFKNTRFVKNLERSKLVMKIDDAWIREIRIIDNPDRYAIGWYSYNTKEMIFNLYSINNFDDGFEKMINLVTFHEMAHAKLMKDGVFHQRIVDMINDGFSSPQEIDGAMEYITQLYARESVDKLSSSIFDNQMHIRLRNAPALESLISKSIENKEYQFISTVIAEYKKFILAGSDEENLIVKLLDKFVKEGKIEPKIAEHIKIAGEEYFWIGEEFEKASQIYHEFLGLGKLKEFGDELSNAIAGKIKPGGSQRELLKYKLGIVGKSDEVLKKTLEEKYANDIGNMIEFGTNGLPKNTFKYFSGKTNNLLFISEGKTNKVYAKTTKIGRGASEEEYEIFRRMEDLTYKIESLIPSKELMLPKSVISRTTIKYTREGDSLKYTLEGEFLFIDEVPGFISFNQLLRQPMGDDMALAKIKEAIEKGYLTIEQKEALQRRMLTDYFFMNVDSHMDNFGILIDGRVAALDREMSMLAPEAADSFILPFNLREMTEIMSDRNNPLYTEFKMIYETDKKEFFRIIEPEYNRLRQLKDMKPQVEEKIEEILDAGATHEIESILKEVLNTLYGIDGQPGRIQQMIDEIEKFKSKI